MRFVGVLIQTTTSPEARQPLPIVGGNREGNENADGSKVSVKELSHSVVIDDEDATVRSTNVELRALRLQNRDTTLRSCRERLRSAS